jgi:hypothetical protein
MAPRKDIEQSDDWRNQAKQSNRSGQGNQQSDQSRGSKQSDLGQGQRQGSRDDLQDEEGGTRGNRGGRDQQR